MSFNEEQAVLDEDYTEILLQPSQMEYFNIKRKENHVQYANFRTMKQKFALTSRILASIVPQTKTLTFVLLGISSLPRCLYCLAESISDAAATIGPPSPTSSPVGLMQTMC